MRTSKLLTISVTVALLFFSSCGGSSDEGSNDTGNSSTETNTPKQEAVSDIGIGPITHVEIGDEIDEQLAMQGKEIFEGKCTACHQFDERYVGPALAGVTKKQKPEWIMNMILNPDRMVKENATAKKLLMQFNAPMANQGLTQDQARSVLEYFRKYNSEKFGSKDSEGKTK